MAYLRQHKVSLSQTQWITEKKRELFFILGAHESLTRREDLKKAIEDHLPGKKPIGLYPKRHIIYNGEKKVSFRALFIDVLDADLEQQKRDISTAFLQNDPRLAGLHLVPVNPSSLTTIHQIAQAATRQNQYSNSLKFFTVPGIIALDTPFSLNQDPTKPFASTLPPSSALPPQTTLKLPSSSPAQSGHIRIIRPF